MLWSDFRSGNSGPGHGETLSTETELFWFFTPSNPELAIKVIDARALDGHFWVFVGALTDVAYTVTVSDTLTGAQRVYESGEAFCGTADTAAFADP